LAGDASVILNLEIPWRLLTFDFRPEGDVSGYSSDKTGPSYLLSSLTKNDFNL